MIQQLVAFGLDTLAVALLAWATWTVYGSLERPSARPFLALLGMLTAWAVLSVEIPGVPAQDLLSGLVTFAGLLCALFIPGFWTLYVLAYTGRGTGLTRWRIAMLAGIAIPTLGGGIGTLLSQSSTTAEAAIFTFGSGLFLYLLGLFAYSTYLFVGHSRTHARISGRQTVMVVTGVAAPYLGGLLGEPTLPADGVTVGFLVAGGLILVALRRYPVLTGFPKTMSVARAQVVEGLQEGVLVLDWENRVLDANATAAELFGVSTQAMIGNAVESLAEGLGGRELSAGSRGSVTLQTTNGQRQYQFSVSSVDDSGTADDEADPMARAVVLRDVTDRETREQRLSVLNRVLRHNVRNKLDVVMAHAEPVEDDQLRSGIEENAAALVELSAKARQAEEVMQASTADPELFDLTAVAAAVVEGYRSDSPADKLSLDGPDELWMRSYPTVVETILSELVDNALTHTDAAQPRVDVTIQEGPGDAATFSVVDNGPGLPDRERRILEEGAETQHQHGSGIGLWLVTWAVRQLGGELSFDENRPSGTIVTVTIFESVSGTADEGYP